MISSPCSKSGCATSALGQKRTSRWLEPMSALCQKRTYAVQQIDVSRYCRYWRILASSWRGLKGRRVLQRSMVAGSDERGSPLALAYE